MQIFVFEYITGGGMLGSTLPRSLVEEGEMMLDALVSDLAEIKGVDVLIIRDARLPVPNLPARCCLVHQPEDFLPLWKECVGSVDAVWPIAPEFHRVLEGISENILAAGKLLLNSPPQALQLAASKYATVHRLAEHGIPTVPTYRPEQALPDIKGRWVIKPDDGVGCQDVSICQDIETLYRRLDSLPAGRSHVVQPFVQGKAVSLCLLAQDGEAHLLSVNRQRMAVTESAFVPLGFLVNGITEGLDRYRQITRDIVAAVPDLWGLLGVDLIATDDGLQVLEINPRLTTCYSGLKESIGSNPAKMVLDLAMGQPLPLNKMMQGKAVDVDLEYAGGL